MAWAVITPSFVQYIECFMLPIGKFSKLLTAIEEKKSLTSRPVKFVWVLERPVWM
jgi:hypothetical protein